MKRTISFICTIFVLLAVIDARKYIEVNDATKLNPVSYKNNYYGSYRSSYKPSYKPSYFGGRVNYGYLEGLDYRYTTTSYDKNKGEFYAYNS